MQDNFQSNQNDKQEPSDLQKDFNRVKEALRDVSQDVQGKTSEFVSHSYADVKKKSHQKADDISDYIKEKPLKSVGIALLVGFIAGKFIR